MLVLLLSFSHYCVDCVYLSIKHIEEEELFVLKISPAASVMTFRKNHMRIRNVHLIVTWTLHTCLSLNTMPIKLNFRLFTVVELTFIVHENFNTHIYFLSLSLTFSARHIHSHVTLYTYIESTLRANNSSPSSIIAFSFSFSFFSLFLFMKW